MDPGISLKLRPSAQRIRPSVVVVRRPLRGQTIPGRPKGGNPTLAAQRLAAFIRFLFLRSDQNENTVAAEMGNSPQMVFRQYRALVRPADCSAFWAIRPVGS
jgi:hypothetical protein